MNLDQGYLEISLFVPQLRDKAFKHLFHLLLWKKNERSCSLICCYGRRTRHPEVSSVVIEDERKILESQLMEEERKILNSLHNIDDLLDSFNPSLTTKFSIKSILTLVVENSFSEMTSDASDMLLQLYFDYRFSSVLEHLPNFIALN